MILIFAYLTECQKLIIHFWHKDWKKIPGLENINLLKLKILMMTSISFCCCCCCFIFCFVQRVTECKILKIDFIAWSFGSKISANEYTVQHPVSHLTQIVQCCFQSFFLSGIKRQCIWVEYFSWGSQTCTRWNLCSVSHVR